MGAQGKITGSSMQTELRGENVAMNGIIAVEKEDFDGDQDCERGFHRELRILSQCLKQNQTQQGNWVV